mmetsp:Transcript_36816/g.70540  ORF Transcript_36816/g.70540 Transcript_36816/m.70540 type:complete len:264 (-) Transcript_36816:120-911(-)
MSGACRRSRQMATRRRSPPDRLATRASGGGQRSASMARSLMRSISHQFLASISFCRRSILAMSPSMSQSGSAIAIPTSSNSFSVSRTGLRAISMLLSTVSPSSRGGSCCRYPILMPSTSSHVPSKSLSTPARIFMRVDLPAPLPPKMPIFAPKYIPSDTFLRSCFPLGDTLLTFCMVRIVLRVSVAYAEPSLTSPGDLKFPPPPPRPPLEPLPDPFLAPFFPFAAITTRVRGTRVGSFVCRRHMDLPCSPCTVVGLYWKRKRA